MHINKKRLPVRDFDKEKKEKELIMKTKILAFLAACFLIVVISMAQNTNQNQPPKPVHIGTGLQSEQLIRALQLADQIHTQNESMLKDQNQYTQLQRQLMDLSSHYTDSQKELEKLAKEAFKAQGISEEDYSFDPSTLNFTKKPAPPPTQKK